MERIQRVEETPPTIDDVCVFCQRLTVGRLLAENEMAVAFRDAFPVSPGHVIIISRRHEADLFDLNELERSAMWDLVAEVRHWIDTEHKPDGYNIGANIQAAGGQSVDHAHLHLIPRYIGDVEDPRGGVRWIIPEEARYW